MKYFSPKHPESNRHGQLSPRRSYTLLVSGVAAVVSCMTLQIASFAQAPATTMIAEETKKDAPSFSDDEIAKIIKQPSSYVSEDEYDIYISTLSAKFAIKKRQMDPFGQVQDPNAKPVIKKTTRKIGKRRTNLKPTSFSEVIDRIKVTTIMPGENRFLIGTRSFRKGDQFPISYRGRLINVKVVGVTSRQIDFENTTNGEIATVEMNLLPPGMEAGTSGITAPGMQPDLKSAPLQIAPGN